MTTTGEKQRSKKEQQAHERARNVSRRMFLRSSLAGAASIGVTGEALARSGPRVRPLGAAGQGAIGDRPNSPLLRLIHHTTQGYQEAAYSEAKGMGYEAWLEWQLDPDSIDDSAMDAVLVGFPTLTMTTKEIFDLYGPPNGNQAVPVIELVSATMLRSLLSRRQLYERMVEFWTDHFNIHIQTGAARFFKTADDRDVIRTHALGRFEDLLRASAKSAAMSNYLNNDTNLAGNINENYSREIMELHTLGVDGPYNEFDVTELARCFTGWSYYPPQHPQFGEFLFRAGQHDNDSKFVLGQNISAGGGQSDGEFMITFLAGHEATAAFVTHKMARWLLGYEPPRGLLDRAAQAFLDSGGQIKDVLRVLLSRAAINALPFEGQPKLRRPMHFVATILRATSPSYNAAMAMRSLNTRLVGMGHTPFGWVAPDGYPDDIDSWGSAVLPRWDLASRLFNNQLQGINFSGSQLLALLDGASEDQIAARIDQVLTGGTLQSDDVSEIQAYVDSFGSLTLPVVREAFALAASSPSFQWY